MLSSVWGLPPPPGQKWFSLNHRNNGLKILSVLNWHPRGLYADETWLALVFIWAVKAWNNIPNFVCNTENGNQEGCVRKCMVASHCWSSHLFCSLLRLRCGESSCTSPVRHLQAVLFGATAELWRPTWLLLAHPGVAGRCQKAVSSVSICFFLQHPYWRKEEPTKFLLLLASSVEVV